MREPEFHHRGVYDAEFGRLEMAFAVEKAPDHPDIRARYFVTVEVKNGLDFDAIRSEAAQMAADYEVQGTEDDPMYRIAGAIFDAVTLGEGDEDNPDAGGFALSWPDGEINWVEMDYGELSIRLMEGGAVRVTASE